MTVELFGGIPVSDYRRALAWYERLLGSEPALLPNATGGGGELAEHRYLYIEELPERAGHALQLVLVDNPLGCCRRVCEEGTPMDTPPVVSPQDWEAARQELLVKEKELTRARDAMAAQRRRMPWMAVEKEYRFEGPSGPVSLADLFDGRRQLIVYRFFYAPDVTTYPAGDGTYPERGCVGCSFLADQVAHPAHLNARDTTLAFVSRAPQAEIQGLKQRMGWDIPWYTMTDDFDADFGVRDWHGTNAFIRDGDRIFRTYFIDARGDEQLGTTWSYLDITAFGRQEEWEDSPEGYPQTPPYQWWNYHDAYRDGG